MGTIWGQHGSVSLLVPWQVSQFQVTEAVKLFLLTHIDINNTDSLVYSHQMP